MKKVIFLIVLSICVLNAYTQQLNSPDGNFQLNFSLSNAGEPVYQLSYKGKEVIKPSKLGLKLKNPPSFTLDFTLKNKEVSSFNETWKPVWGEVSQISNHYNELLVTLEQTKQNRYMKIRFRLFNDGLGFRYEFDRQPELSYFQVLDECTEFALTGDHKAFWIPGDYDTNEYY